MPFINLTTSRENQEIVKRLTRKLFLHGTGENVIARIALGYSLSTGKHFEQKEFNKYDSAGKEYKESVLFDDLKDFYIAMVCEAYTIRKDSELLPKYIKLHIDHGLEEMNKIFNSDNPPDFFEFLAENLPSGIKALENTPSVSPLAPNNNQHIREKDEFLDPIDITVGHYLDNGDEVKLQFNRRTNQHIAIAGKSGSGKTQFALEFLRQLHEQTRGQVNFLFLDFKGLGNEDKINMKNFFEGTNTTFISPSGSDRFPLNPISFIDNVNAQNRTMGIDKLVDTITQYVEAGSRQQQALRTAIFEAFNKKKDGSYPSFKEIYNLIGDDAVRGNLSVIQRLGEYDLFEEGNTNNDQSSFLDGNYYFSLPPMLDHTTRLTSVFLVINYIVHVFSNMSAAKVKDGIRGIRYVLMIDEAHNLFNNKKSLGVLEMLLRQMRSSGVSVILLSQSIKDYDTKNFNFSSECATAFLLPINDLTIRQIKKFLGLPDKANQRLSNKLNYLNDGCAISNIERENIDVFKIAQYFENNK